MVRIFSLGIAVITAVACVPEDQSAKQPVTKTDAAPPAIEIWLGEPVEKIKRWKWPYSPVTGKPLPSGFVESPSRLTVHFPSGRSFTTVARVAVIGKTGKDLVREVSLNPPVNHKPYREITAEVERLMKELNLQESSKVRHPFRDWKDQEPDETFLTRATGGRVEKGIEGRLAVKGSLSGEGLWMVTLDLCVPRLFGDHDEEIEREERGGR